MTVAQEVQTFQNYIGGEWRSSSSGELIEVHNPATGELAYRAQKSTAEDARQAVQAARNTFATSDWSDNPDVRAKALYRLAQAMHPRLDDFARTLVAESGKLFVTGRGETNRAIDTVEYYAGLARNVYGRSITLGPDTTALLMREPVGVVGIVVPWNMPLALMMRSLAPALAAGNAVVVKPASYTPAATAEFFKLIDEIEEFPKGIANLVTGTGETVGATLVADPDVDMIAATADTSTGKQIMRQAADTLKKVSLELGGKSPSIIFDDYSMDKAIRNVMTGAAFYAGGQVCYAATRMLVQQDIHDRFVESARATVEKMRVGPGMERGVQVGPVISTAQLERVLGYIEQGKKEAKLVAGGSRVTEGDLARGNFIAPTIFDEVDPSAKLAQEEIFGPVVSIIPFANEDEAIQIANNSIYGLAASIWTNDLNRAMRMARKVRAGTIWINTYGKLYSQTEMGGLKQSGLGVQYGLEGLWEFTELKHINIQLEKQEKPEK